MSYCYNQKKKESCKVYLLTWLSKKSQGGYRINYKEISGFETVALSKLNATWNLMCKRDKGSLLGGAACTSRQKPHHCRNQGSRNTIGKCTVQRLGFRGRGGGWRWLVLEWSERASGTQQNPC